MGSGGRDNKSDKVFNIIFTVQVGLILAVVALIVYLSLTPPNQPWIISLNQSLIWFNQTSYNIVNNACTQTLHALRLLHAHQACSPAMTDQFLNAIALILGFIGYLVLFEFIGYSISNIHVTPHY